MGGGWTGSPSLTMHSTNSVMVHFLHRQDCTALQRQLCSSTRLYAAAHCAQAPESIAIQIAIFHCAIGKMHSTHCARSANSKDYTALQQHRLCNSTGLFAAAGHSAQAAANSIATQSHQHTMCRGCIDF